MKVVHTLSAFNTARGVENPLHNDEAARQLGYRAGLIGGVDMYGYMTYAAVQKWGGEWLESGEAECLLSRPVHEGDPCSVLLTQDRGDSIEVELHAHGEMCAKALFRRRGAQTDRPRLLATCEAPTTRPLANSASLAEGTPLPTLRVAQDESAAQQFLLDERDDLPIYTLTRLSHPGYLLRLCNFTLSRNFVLGPWIHTASKIRNYQAVPLSAEVEVRSRILAHYERRGHLMVDVEVQLLTGEEKLACAVIHSAIYQPRKG